MNRIYYGIDGCKNGWVAARLEDNRLSIEFYETISKFIQAKCAIEEIISLCKETATFPSEYNLDGVELPPDLVTIVSGND